MAHKSWGLYKEVHRQNFHSMRQKEWKSIMHFLARLWTLEKFCLFTVTDPNKPDCCWQIDYCSNMMARQMAAGFTITEHQSKTLAKAVILSTLQQKFYLLVSLEITDHSKPLYFSNILHHTTTANVQRSNCKKQSWEVRTSPTPQSTKPCRGCGEYSYPNGLSNWKDCLAAKMVNFNFGIIRHMERVCQKPKRESVNKSAASMMREESHTPTIRRYTDI